MPLYLKDDTFGASMVRPMGLLNPINHNSSRELLEMLIHPLIAQPASVNI
ncbi:hypothetical protein HanPSC8_Chr16g0718911 [Helianthus annuus]|nr:hypothetical protein HanPSC8_Chr16g0718911 [Helianthus annuus]